MTTASPTRRSSGVFALLIGLGGAVILTGLGVWQTQRLFEKEAQLAEIEQRAEAQPAALTGDETPDLFEHRHVIASGAFIDEQAASVLASQKAHGPGARIIGVFELESGVRVLVDRGFAPQSVKLAPLQPKAARLQGVLRWPNEINSFTPKPNVAEGRWFARDVPSMALALNTRPVLVELSSNPTNARWPQASVSALEIPNNHFGYAVTWYSLAAIWLGMTLFWLRRA